MDGAISAIKDKIAKCQSRISELEESKKQIEAELPRVRGDLDALTRTLSILGGKPIPVIQEDPVTTSGSTGGHKLRENSTSSAAYSILKESRVALTPKDLFERVRNIKPDAKKNSFLSGIYRLIREQIIFKLDAGKIGLVEWEK
jgi:hypothetical protein